MLKNPHLRPPDKPKLYKFFDLSGKPNIACLFFLIFLLATLYISHPVSFIPFLSANNQYIVE
jgi:hypothetical protein